MQNAILYFCARVDLGILRQSVAIICTWTLETDDDSLQCGNNGTQVGGHNQSLGIMERVVGLDR